MEFRLSTWKIFPVVLFVFLLMNCSTEFGSNAQLLPEEEVQTLEVISTKLHNKYWTMTTTSCNDGSLLNVTLAGKILVNITCDCTFPNNTCHVTNFLMKGKNLTGVIPEEFGNLTYLREIDLTRNYLNGSIPTSLARLPLVTLSALGNRLSGSIPKEIGDIATLQELILEDNQLEGPLPDNLGNLGRLSRLLISANNFTGSIPETYGNLKNLTDFRIDGSSLSGKIPDFIGNWTKLDRLDLQGTSMEGPIPSAISLFTNITELRITDLSGPSSVFPDLQDLKSLETLIMRNCIITGSIPDYIG